jgi:RNA polymerase sigma-70 factor, ECF subfamily
MNLLASDRLLFVNRPKSVPFLTTAVTLFAMSMGNEHDAEDVVQEASLRALRYFRTFTSGNGRAWFLRIVRNTCCGCAGTACQHRPTCSMKTGTVLDGGLTLKACCFTPMTSEQAMRNLPDRFRELLVLRELEGLSYRELADVMGIPIGPVMSSLSRARQAFRSALNNQLKQCGIPERRHSREQEPDAVLV